MTGVLAATSLGEAERSQVAAMLRDGYGVEDVAVRLRMNLDEVRACVGYWREHGYLYRILGTDRRRNEAARAVMAGGH